MAGKAVHIGAGNIGRGFIGQLYYESGYHTTFIDVVEAVVSAIQREKAYPVDLVTDEAVERIWVRNIDAIDGRDLDQAARALAEADIASTAVGLNAMPHIIPLLARAVEIRFADADAPPLDIILCENINNAGDYVRKLVLEKLDPAFHAVFREQVGLVEASIGRMVPVMTPEKQAETPLLVCVEPYCEMPVDSQGFKGPLPPIKHLKPAPNFAAYVERKLFAHNMTHACTAYLGFLKGYEYIYEAIRDSKIRAIVEDAGRESCQALAAKHAMPVMELQAHLDDLIQRYHNRALADQIIRVARDPLRKLAPGDRLIGAATTCVAQGIAPENIALGIAAALQYAPDDPADPTVAAMQEQLQTQGVTGFLSAYCQLDPAMPPGSLVCMARDRLRERLG